MPEAKKPEHIEHGDHIEPDRYEDY